MTDENINLVLTNVMCCLGNYGVKVSKLLSINDSCAASEVVKLKLLHDYYEAVRCYNTDITDPPIENCLTQEEFDILINRLMKACDICPCQLKP